jgi:hypothetical protein
MDLKDFADDSCGVTVSHSMKRSCTDTLLSRASMYFPFVFSAVVSNQRA